MIALVGLLSCSLLGHCYESADLMTLLEKKIDRCNKKCLCPQSIRTACFGARGKSCSTGLKEALLGLDSDGAEPVSTEAKEALGGKEEEVATLLRYSLVILSLNHSSSHFRVFGCVCYVITCVAKGNSLRAGW